MLGLEIFQPALPHCIPMRALKQSDQILIMDFGSSSVCVHHECVKKLMPKKSRDHVGKNPFRSTEKYLAIEDSCFEPTLILSIC